MNYFDHIPLRSGPGRLNVGSRTGWQWHGIGHANELGIIAILGGGDFADGGAVARPNDGDAAATRTIRHTCHFMLLSILRQRTSFIYV